MMFVSKRVNLVKFSMDQCQRAMIHQLGICGIVFLDHGTSMNLPHLEGMVFL